MRTEDELRTFERDVLLATGRAVRIRPARPPDINALREFYDELSDTSTYYRFFGLRPLARGTVELPEAVRPGMTLRIDAGGVAVSLRPRHLEAPVPALRT